MSKRTFINQSQQIGNSESYDITGLVPSADLQNNAETLQDDLKALRVMVKAAVGGQDWYSAPDASLANLAGRVTSAEGDIDSLEGRVTTAEGDIDSLEGRATSLEGRVTTAEGDIDALEGRMTTAESDIDAVEVRMTAAEGDIDALEGRMTTAESDIDAVEVRMTAAEGDIDSLQAFQATAENQISGLEQFQSDATSHFVTLDGRMDTAEADIDSLEGRATSLEGRVTTAEGDIDALEGRATSLEGRVTTAEADIDALEGRADSLESRMTTAEGDIDALEGRMTTAEGDIDALEGRMTTAESDIDTLQSDVANLGNDKVAKAGDTMTGMLSILVNNAPAVPQNPEDVVTKKYLDGLVQGLSFKAPAKIRYNLANGGTLPNSPQPNWQPPLAEGDRVLVISATEPARSGIYVVNAAGIEWSRAADFAADSTQDGSFVFVQAGDYADTSWVQIGSGTVGTDAMDFVQFDAPSNYSAGLGLVLSDMVFSIDQGGVVEDMIAAGAVTQAKLSLVAPVADADAATKKYVDDADALKLDLAGGTMSGDINMGNHNLNSVGSVTANGNVFTSGTVEASTALKTDGSITGGALTANGAAELKAGLTVTGGGTSVTTLSASGQISGDNGLQLTGGALDVWNGATFGMSVTAKGGVLLQDANSNPLSPSSDASAVNKKYVDDSIANLDSRVEKVFAEVTGNVSANVPVYGGNTFGAKLSAELPQLPDTDAAFDAKIDVYLNGQLLRAGAGNDVNIVANNDKALEFTFPLSEGDVICVIKYS